MDTLQQDDVLTAADARTLLAAARTLREIEDRATKASVTDAYLRDSTLRNFGRLAEACDIAEDLLFNVLNAAVSRCDLTAAQDALKTWNE